MINSLYNCILCKNCFLWKYVTYHAFYKTFLLSKNSHFTYTYVKLRLLYSLLNLTRQEIFHCQIDCTMYSLVLQWPNEFPNTIIVPQSSVGILTFIIYRCSCVGAGSRLLRVCFTALRRAIIYLRNGRAYDTSCANYVEQ